MPYRMTPSVRHRAIEVRYYYYHYVLGFAAVLNTANGVVNIFPSSRVVSMVGEEVKFICNNSIEDHDVTWSMVPYNSPAECRELYHAHSTNDIFESMYSVEPVGPQVWKLSFVVSDFRDAGLYSCCDDEGCSKSSASVSLSVLGEHQCFCVIQSWKKVTASRVPHFMFTQPDPNSFLPK